MDDEISGVDPPILLRSGERGVSIPLDGESAEGQQAKKAPEIDRHKFGYQNYCIASTAAFARDNFEIAEPSLNGSSSQK